MKITAIELFDISIPFLKPYKLSKVYGTLTHADAIVLKIRTDAGITGWGEADPKHPFTEDTPASITLAIQDHIAPLLLGRDPTRIARIEAELDKAVTGDLMARGAVNMALYDILGKAHGLPAHTFLGGLLHERLPLLGPIGSGTPAEDAEAIDQLVDEGYRTVMIKMGALPIEDEIERTIAAHRKYGDRITFIADANQGWTFEEALRFMDGIQGHEPALIEQPIERNDIDGLTQVCNRATCLLSADESMVTRREADQLIRREAANVFSIKVSKNGGLVKSKSIANAADLFGVQCLMNSMLEFGITQAASLQLGCTLGNLMACGHAYMSVLRMSDDFTDFANYISNAVVTVPDAPGLGIEIDQAKLEKYKNNYLRFNL